MDFRENYGTGHERGGRKDQNPRRPVVETPGDPDSTLHVQGREDR